MHTGLRRRQGVPESHDDCVRGEYLIDLLNRLPALLKREGDRGQHEQKNGRDDSRDARLDRREEPDPFFPHFSSSKDRVSSASYRSAVTGVMP